jgi:DNA-binding IclR family transcriptional regulator
VASAGTGRTLKTARAVLRVLHLLETHRGGLTVAEVAERLDRSRSTASNLLNTLRAEGFAVRDELTATYHRAGRVTLAPTIDPAVLRELFDRTGERTYLATNEPPDRIVVQDSRGRQGVPYVPDLRPDIGGEAHALAVGKAVLAHLGPDAVDRYVDAYGMRRFTGRTVTEAAVLEDELATVRDRGVAVDVEEFAEGFCCIAAPMLADDGAPLGAVALSVNVARFERFGDHLADEVAAAADTALGRLRSEAADR